jgi:hypothetical protein
MRAAYLPENDGTSSNKQPQVSNIRLKLQSIRDYLPPWLGGKPRNPDSQALTPMLSALKAAAESHLEITISNAGVAAPFGVTEEYVEAIRSTYSALSLTKDFIWRAPAGMMAAPIYRIGVHPCFDSSPVFAPQMFLTVEYTRAALTAYVMYEACNIYDERRVLHDTDLGLDQLAELGSELYAQKLESSLRKLVSLPFNDGGEGARIKYLSNLAFLGESAEEPHLHEVLKRVLGEQYGQLMTSYRGGRIDPLFAGSRGVAHSLWFQQTMDEGGDPRDGSPIQWPDRVELK